MFWDDDDDAVVVVAVVAVDDDVEVEKSGPQSSGLGSVNFANNETASVISAVI